MAAVQKLLDNGLPNGASFPVLTNVSLPQPMLLSRPKGSSTLECKISADALGMSAAVTSGAAAVHFKAQITSGCKRPWPGAVQTGARHNLFSHCLNLM